MRWMRLAAAAACKTNAVIMLGEQNDALRSTQHTLITTQESSTAEIPLLFLGCFVGEFQSCTEMAQLTEGGLKGHLLRRRHISEASTTIVRELWV
jgi:hypothetical protein